MNINDAYLWLKSIEGVTNNNINQIDNKSGCCRQKSQ